MSIAKEEAITILQHLAEIIRSGDYQETFRMAASALRPITREQVEKVWRGEWEPGNPICPICGKGKFDGLDADIWADWMPNFCPHCGAPMTDEAVEMAMEKINNMEEMTNEH